MQNGEIKMKNKKNDNIFLSQCQLKWKEQEMQG